MYSLWSGGYGVSSHLGEGDLSGVDLGGVPPATLPPNLPRTPDSRPSPIAVTEKMVPPHHFPLIGLLLLPGIHTTWIADHPHRHFKIGIYPNPVKYIRKDIQLRLQAGWSGRGKYPVVGVK